MYVKEIWRYPVKSLKGESLQRAYVGGNGVDDDRRVLVVSDGRVITSRIRPGLLALQGGVADDGTATVEGFDWRSQEALKLIRDAAGSTAELVGASEGAFDVLPLSIATDGTADYLGIDRRRLRPNIVIGGVHCLAEREWQGRLLKLGDATIYAARLRPRCVMTTWDPDTQEQDLSVLRRIVDELGGTASLDCAVDAAGLVEIGTPALLAAPQGRGFLSERPRA